MSNQSLFTTVATHLLDQARWSSNDAGFCLYRGKDDCRCAIGALIPDELYDGAMEGVGVMDLPEKFPALTPIFPKKSLELLQELQLCHDGHAPCDWPRELTRIARAYRLTPLPV